LCLHQIIKHTSGLHTQITVIHMAKDGTKTTNDGV